MQTRGTYLAGLGVYIPEPQSIDSAVEQGLVTHRLAAESGLSGVAVAGDMPPYEMALQAATGALKSSGLSAADIDLLLYTGVWHQGPDGWGPQYYLQRNLLGDDLLAVEVKNGCNGFFSALELAIPFLRVCPDGHGALVAASDNFGTPLINRWEHAGGLAFLGDAATAVVLTRSPGFAEVLCVCSDGFSEMEEAHRSGEPLFPPGVTIGATVHFGNRADKFRDAAIAEGRWMRFLLGHQERNVRSVANALEESGLQASKIKYVVSHSMPRQSAVSYLKLLGFPFERSPWEFSRTVGHLGASDHVAALNYLLSENRVEPGDHVLFCGFSPGLTYKSAVIRIIESGRVGAKKRQVDGF
jgi:clorobiocin biosynthesis protein CloN2